MHIIDGHNLLHAIYKTAGDTEAISEVGLCRAVGCFLELTGEKGEIIFRTGELGEYLYILTEGSVELIYIAKDDRDPEIEKEILVGEIRPGEPFGISSFIEPHILTATAKVTCAGKAIKITAEKLHALCENDPQMAYGLMSRIAEATLERLGYTRIQLAAAKD